MWNPFYFFFSFGICISYIRLNLLNKHCITEGLSAPLSPQGARLRTASNWGLWKREKRAKGTAESCHGGGAAHGEQSSTGTRGAAQTSTSLLAKFILGHLVLFLFLFCCETMKLSSRFGESSPSPPGKRSFFIISFIHSVQ